MSQELDLTIYLSHTAQEALEALGYKWEESTSSYRKQGLERDKGLGVLLYNTSISPGLMGVVIRVREFSSDYRMTLITEEQVIEWTRLFDCFNRASVSEQEQLKGWGYTFAKGESVSASINDKLKSFE